MEFKKLIDKESIILELQGSSRDEVLNELANCFVNQKVIKSKKHFIDDVKNREAIGSTSVGFGVAIPHGKSESVKRPALAIGRKSKGFYWDEKRTEKTRLVFLIAVPVKNSNNTYLEMIANLSRRLLDSEFRQSLLTADNHVEILNLLKGGDSEIVVDKAGSV